MNIDLSVYGIGAIEISKDPSKMELFFPWEGFLQYFMSVDFFSEKRDQFNEFVNQYDVITIYNGKQEKYCYSVWKEDKLLFIIHDYGQSKWYFKVDWLRVLDKEELQKIINFAGQLNIPNLDDILTEAELKID